MRQYAVTQKDGEWTVFESGKPLESGLSRSAAIRMAEDLAFQAEENGEPVELLIQDYSGELKERRSFGP
jgi:galactokinase